MRGRDAPGTRGPGARPEVLARPRPPNPAGRALVNRGLIRLVGQAGPAGVQPASRAAASVIFSRSPSPMNRMRMHCALWKRGTPGTTVTSRLGSRTAGSAPAARPVGGWARAAGRAAGVAWSLAAGWSCGARGLGRRCLRWLGLGGRGGSEPALGGRAPEAAGWSGRARATLGSWRAATTVLADLILSLASLRRAAGSGCWGSARGGARGRPFSRPGWGCGGGLGGCRAGAFAGAEDAEPGLVRVTGWACRGCRGSRGLGRAPPARPGLRAGRGRAERLAGRGGRGRAAGWAGGGGSAAGRCWPGGRRPGLTRRAPGRLARRRAAPAAAGGGRCGGWPRPARLRDPAAGSWSRRPGPAAGIGRWAGLCAPALRLRPSWADRTAHAG